MQWEAASLFATPVFKFELGDIKNVKTFFYDHIKDTSKKQIDQQGALSHYFSKKNVFDLFPQLNPLGNQLGQAANFVYQDLLNYKKSGDMYMTNAWFNLCEMGGAQPAHNHVNCLLCGTLYLEADEHSYLHFFHPQNNSSFHSELYDKADEEENSHGLRFHKLETRISVKAGDCLFWPSSLKHGYRDNQTPGRLSLSFNMMPSQLNVDYQPFNQS